MDRLSRLIGIANNIQNQSGTPRTFYMVNARAMQMYMNPGQTIDTKNIYTKFTQRLQHYQTDGEFGSYIMPVQEVPDALINQLLGVVKHSTDDTYSIDLSTLDQTKFTNINFDRISLPYVYFDQKQNRFLINSGQQLGGDQPMQYNQFTSDMYDINGSVAGVYVQRKGKTDEYEFFDFNVPEQVNKLNQLIQDTNNQFADVNVQVKVNLRYKKTGKTTDDDIYVMLGGAPQIKTLYREVMNTINQGAMSYQQIDQNIRGVLNKLVTQTTTDANGNTIEVPLNVDDFQNITQQPVQSTKGVPDQLTALKHTITETMSRTDVSVYSLSKDLSNKDIRAIAKKIKAVKDTTEKQPLVLLDLSEITGDDPYHVNRLLYKIAAEIENVNINTYDVTLLYPTIRDYIMPYVKQLESEEDKQLFLEQQDYLNRIQESSVQYEHSQEFNGNVNQTLTKSLSQEQPTNQPDVQDTLFNVATGKSQIQPDQRIVQKLGVTVDTEQVQSSIKNITQQQIRRSMYESTTQFKEQITSIDKAINQIILPNYKTGQQYGESLQLKREIEELKVAKSKFDAANTVMQSTRDAGEYTRQYYDAEQQYREYMEKVNALTGDQSTTTDRGPLKAIIQDQASKEANDNIQQIVNNQIQEADTPFAKNRIVKKFVDQNGHIDRDQIQQFMSNLSTDQLSTDLNATVSLDVNSLSKATHETISQNVHKHILEQFGVQLELKDRSLSNEEIEQLYNQVIPEDMRRWIDEQIEQHSNTLVEEFRQASIEFGRDQDITDRKRFIEIGTEVVKKKTKKGYKKEYRKITISTDELLSQIYAILLSNKEGNNDITLRNLFYGFADKSGTDKQLFDVITQSTQRQDYSVVSSQISGMLSGLLRIAIRTGLLTGDTIRTTREQLMPTTIDVRNAGQLFVKQIAVRQGQQLINAEITKRGSKANIYERMRFYNLASGGNSTQFYRNVYPHELMNKTNKTLNQSGASDILMKLLDARARNERRIKRSSYINDRFSTAINIIRVQNKYDKQSRIPKQGDESFELMRQEKNVEKINKYLHNVKSNINRSYIARQIADNTTDSTHKTSVIANYQGLNFRTLTNMYQNEFEKYYIDPNGSKISGSNVSFVEAFSKERITRKQFIESIRPEHRVRQFDIIDRYLEEQEQPGVDLDELQRRYVQEILPIWKPTEQVDKERAIAQIGNTLQTYRQNHYSLGNLAKRLNENLVTLDYSHITGQDRLITESNILSLFNNAQYKKQDNIDELRENTIKFVNEATKQITGSEADNAFDQVVNMLSEDFKNFNIGVEQIKSPNFESQVREIVYASAASRILTQLTDQFKLPSAEADIDQMLNNIQDVAKNNNVYKLFRNDRGLDILAYIGQTYYKFAGQLTASGMSDKRAKNLTKAIFGIETAEGFMFPNIDNVINPVNMLINRIAELEAEISVPLMQQKGELASEEVHLERALKDIMGLDTEDGLYDTKKTVQENLQVFLDRADRLVNNIIDVNVTQDTIQQLLYGKKSWNDVDDQTEPIDQELQKYINKLYQKLQGTAGSSGTTKDTLRETLKAQPNSVKVAMASQLMDIFHINSISDISSEEDMLALIDILNDEQVGKANVQSTEQALIKTDRKALKKFKTSKSTDRKVIHLLNKTESNNLRAWFTNLVNNEMQQIQSGGESNIGTFITYNNAKQFILANTAVKIAGDANLVFSIKKKKHGKYTVSSLKLIVSEQNVHEAQPFILNRTNQILQDQLYNATQEQIYKDMSNIVEISETLNGYRQALNKETQEGLKAIENQVVDNNYDELQDLITNKPQQFNEQLNTIFYSQLLSKQIVENSKGTTGDIGMQSMVLTQILREASVYKDKGNIIDYFTTLDINNTRVDDFIRSRFNIESNYGSTIADFLKEKINNVSGFVQVLTGGTALADIITEAIDTKTGKLDEQLFVKQVSSKMNEPDQLFKLQYFFSQQDTQVRSMIKDTNVEAFPLGETINTIRSRLIDALQSQMNRQQTRLYNLGISEGQRQLKANYTTSNEILQEQMQYVVNGQREHGGKIELTNDVDISHTLEPLENIFKAHNVNISQDNMDKLQVHMWSMYSTTGHMEAFYGLQAEIEEGLTKGKNVQPYISKLSTETQDIMNELIFQIEEVSGPDIANKYIERMQTNPDQFEDIIAEMLAVAKINGAHISNLNLGSEFEVIVSKQKQYYYSARQVPKLFKQLEGQTLTIDEFNNKVQKALGGTEKVISADFADLGRTLDWLQTTEEQPDVVMIANNQVLVREEIKGIKDGKETSEKVIKFVAAKENGKGGKVITISPHYQGGQDLFMLSIGQITDQDQKYLESLSLIDEGNVQTGEEVAKRIPVYEQRVARGEARTYSNNAKNISQGAADNVQRDVSKEQVEDISDSVARQKQEAPSWVEQFKNVVGDWMNDAKQLMIDHPRQTAGIQQQATAVSVVGMQQRQQYKDDINDYKQIIKYNQYKELPPIIPIKPSQVTLNGMYQQHMYNNYIYRQGGWQ